MRCPPYDDTSSRMLDAAVVDVTSESITKDLLRARSSRLRQNRRWKRNRPEEPTLTGRQRPTSFSIPGGRNVSTGVTSASTRSAIDVATSAGSSWLCSTMARTSDSA